MQILATFLAFGRGTTFEQATASPAGDPPIIPAEYAFLIWSVIYAGSVCYGIYQYRRSAEKDPLLRRIRPYTASAFTATVCWLISARFNLTGLTVVCIVWLAASLLPAFLRLAHSRQEFGFLDHFAIVIPLSIYTGWVTIAVFANVSALLYQRGLLNVILTPVWWAVIMVIAAGIIAVLLTYRTKNVPFALTVCWALVGILVANLTRTYHSEVVLTCAVVIGTELLVLALSKWRSACTFDWKPRPMTTFAALEDQRLEIISTVQDWPGVRLAFRPAPDAWSAVEVLDHLVKVEDRITAAARIGLRAPHPTGLRDRLGFLFMDRLFRSKHRVKVPRSAAEVLPERMARLDLVCQRWALTRSELVHLLGSLPPNQLQVGVFRHPVSGWMTVPQILRFFSVHMQHHRFQLTRLRVASECELSHKF